MVFILLLIGREGDAGFLNQSQSVVNILIKAKRTNSNTNYFRNSSEKCIFQRRLQLGPSKLLPFVLFYYVLYN